MKTKNCPSCNIVKPIKEFWKNKAKADGLQSICKECHYNKYNVNKDKKKQRVVSRRHYHYGGGKEKKQEYLQTEKGKRVIQKAQLKYRESGKKRDHQLERLYGITLAEYDEMFEKQKGLCNICGKPSMNGKRLCVDHNHETGEIRGLLCNWCNLRLGWYERNQQKVDKYVNN